MSVNGGGSGPSSPRWPSPPNGARCCSATGSVRSTDSARASPHHEQRFSGRFKPLSIPCEPPLVEFNAPIKGELEARTDAISSYRKDNSPKAVKRKSLVREDNFDVPLGTELGDSSKIAHYDARASPTLHASTSKHEDFNKPIEAELDEFHKRKIANYDIRDSPTSHARKVLNLDKPLAAELDDHTKIAHYDARNSPKTLSRRNSAEVDEVPLIDEKAPKIAHYDVRNSPKTMSRRNSAEIDEVPLIDEKTPKIAHYDANNSPKPRRSFGSARNDSGRNEEPILASLPPSQSNTQNRTLDFHHIYEPVAKEEVILNSITPSGLVESQERERGEGSSHCICEKVHMSVRKFHNSLGHVQGFVAFNIICLLQTIPALTYYVYFFEPGYSLPNSAGMTVVWPCTIGAISSLIVTLPIGPPLPAGLLSESFCIAIILWMFVIALSTCIAGVALATVDDYHAMGWSFVCCISGILSGLYLIWYGTQVKKNKKASRRSEDGSYTGTMTNSASIISRHPSENDIELNDVQLQIDAASSATLRENNKDELKLSIAAVKSVKSKPLPMHPAVRGRKGVQTSSVAGSTNVSESGSETESPLKMKLFLVLRCFLWSVLFIFYVIPLGFGITSCLIAHERVLYPYPGRILQVKSSTIHGETEILSMHINCIGSISISRPIILLEADHGISGFAFWKLQHALKDRGWRVCSYDRPGYGWTDMPALGSTSTPKKNIDRLYDLIVESRELEKNRGNGALLLGHGSGGELMQIFAYSYPNITAGMALLDAYPNHDMLRGRSNEDIEKRVDLLCGNVNMARALESTGLTRPYTDNALAVEKKDGTIFKPLSELDRYRSTMMNNKYWAALYNDACVYTDSVVRATNYLKEVGTEEGRHGLKWPQLAANVPVLIIAAGEMVHKRHQHKIFLEQALLYNSTVSPTNSSKFVICNGCDRNFPYNKHADWLAIEIDNYFSNV